jgi:predicted TIM-barrel fold metal-dependent hydrolase
MTTEPYRIDVHHHVMPPEYVAAAKQAGIIEGGGVDFPAWSVEAALAFMDQAGIATAISSVSAPGVHFGDDQKARSLARRVNEFSAKLVSDHPARFGGFASLPLPDVDGALRELEYATDTLKLDGVVLMASIGEKYLGDPAFDALFAELNRRKTVAFVHPTVHPSSQRLKLDLPGALVEFVFDTTRAATNLIYSGTMERYPDLRIILSHAGGTVPFVAGRLTLGKLVPKLDAKAPQGAIAYLKRFYYDTALSANPYALDSLTALVDASQILFGSDFPFLPGPRGVQSARDTDTYVSSDAAVRMAVARDNALALFPRLRAAQPALAR